MRVETYIAAIHKFHDKAVVVAALYDVIQPHNVLTVQHLHNPDFIEQVSFLLLIQVISNTS